jgi:predicted amidohydrolase/GNAT superfamily N-acetyltransferase
MLICIAQTQSLKGKIQESIEKHIRIINYAVKLNADLIVFPELSITGYEPILAKELACNSQDVRFNAFQEIANKTGITIGVGMPTNSREGINISMLFFQPKTKCLVYSKQMLHSDELPYFVCGKEQVILSIKEMKIAFGICYETLQREHFAKAYQKGIDIYIASVAKPKGGIEKAYKHFHKIAKEFSIPILMSNCVGFCDNFLSVGQSAVWNKKGELIEQLDDINQGILVYNTGLEKTEKHQLRIERAQISDLKEVFQIYLNGKNDLEKNGIYQWTENYLTSAIIESDIIKGALYKLKNNNEILGAINISEEQETEYKEINWEFDNSKVLVIHRLVINPKHQNQGFANILMDYAECFARENHYSSIRLDAYSHNTKAIEFYRKRNYIIRGEVYFLGREYPFHCMEKKI